MSWWKKKLGDVTAKFSAEQGDQQPQQTFECTMCLGEKFTSLEDLQSHYLHKHTTPASDATDAGSSGDLIDMGDDVNGDRFNEPSQHDSQPTQDVAMAPPSTKATATDDHDHDHDHDQQRSTSPFSSSTPSMGDKRKKERAAREVIRLENEVGEWKTRCQEERYHNEMLQQELEKLEKKLAERNQSGGDGTNDSKQEVKFLRRENVQLKSQLEDLERREKKHKAALEANVSLASSDGSATSNPEFSAASLQLIENHKTEIERLARERDEALTASEDSKTLLDELLGEREALEEKLRRAAEKGTSVDQLREEVAVKTQTVRSLEAQVALLQQQKDADDIAVEMESLRTCFAESEARNTLLSAELEKLQAAQASKEDGAVEELKKLQETISRQQAQITEHEAIRSKYETAEVSAKEAAARQEADLTAAWSERDALSETIAELRAALASKGKEADEWEAKFKESESERTEASSQIENLQRQLGALKEENAATLASLDAKADELKAAQAVSPTVSSAAIQKDSTAPGDDGQDRAFVEAAEALAQTQNLVAELRKQLSGAEETIAHLTSEKKELQVQIDTAAAQYKSNTDSKASEAEAAIASLREQTASLAAEVEQLRGERDSLKAAVSELENEARDAREEAALLQSSSADKDKERLQQHTSALEEKDAMVESLKREVAAYTARLADMMKKSDDQKDQIKRIREDLQMAQVAVSSTQETLVAARAEAKDKDDEIMSLQGINMSLEAALANEKKAHQETHAAAAIVDEKNAVIELLEKKIYNVTTEKTKLLERVKEHQHACEVLQSELEEVRATMDSQLGMAAKERKSLSEKVKMQIKQLDEAAEENETLRERLTRKQELEEQVEGQLKAAEKATAELQSRMVKAEELLALPCEVCREYEGEVAALSAKLTATEADLEAAKADNARKSVQFERMNADLEAQSKEMDRINHARDDLEQKLKQAREALEQTKAQLEGLCSSQTDELDQLKNDLFKKESEVKVFLKEKAQASLELEAQKTKMEELEEKLGEQAVALRAAVAEKEDAEHSLEQTKSMFVKTKMASEKEIEKLQATLNASEASLAELKASSSHSQQQLHEKVHALRAAYDKEMQASARSRDEHQRLKTQLDEQLRRNEQEVSALRASALSLEMQHEESQKKLVQAQTDAQLASEKLRAVEAEKQGLLDQLMALETTSREELQRLRAELDQKQLGLMELTQRYQDVAVSLTKQNESKWVNDKEAKECQGCGSKFGVKRRRHHCRKCGGVFCNPCSKNSALLPSSKHPERVCDTCFKEM